MKTIQSPLFLAVLLAVSLPLALCAQEMSSGNAPSTNQEAPPPSLPGPRGPMANLTEQERTLLKTTHDKAIQQNPALEEAMKSARQAMEKARKDLHDAMIAIDPSIAPILTKIEPPKWGGQGKGLRGGAGKEGDGYGGQRHAPPPGMANLTERERTQLKAAHELIKNDSAVVSARETLKTATTPEERKSAHEALRQASDAALIKADPSLGPVLEKLHQAGPPSGDSDSSKSTKKEIMTPQE